LRERVGGDFSPRLSGTGSNMSLKKPNATVICPAISLMSLALLMLLKPTYSAPYCVTQTGRLKTRDLTLRDYQYCGDSRDLTTRHHIARVDIARLVSVFE